MVELSPYLTKLSAIPVRQLSLEIDGGTTAYWDYGPLEAEIMVFIHGFRGDHHGLLPIVAQLPEYRIIVPDLPGFGESTPISAHTLTGYCNWLHRFIEKVCDRVPYTLLGHSFGSTITTAAVAEFAVKPQKLVLINPIGTPALEGPKGAFTQLAVFYYWLAARLPCRLGLALLQMKLIVWVMSSSMAKTRDRRLRHWIHGQHYQYFAPVRHRSAVLSAFRTAVNHDVSEYAARVPLPTLLIVGEKDDITPLPAQLKLSEKFATHQLSVIPAVGHLVHYETPVAAAAAITAFLQDER